MSLVPSQSKSQLLNSILRLKDIIKPHLSWCLGNGNSIKFWKDRWTGDHKLRRLYRGAYDKALNKGCSVSSQGRWEGTCWRWKILLRERHSISAEVDFLLEHVEALHCCRLTDMVDLPLQILHGEYPLQKNRYQRSVLPLQRPHLKQYPPKKGESLPLAAAQRPSKAVAMCVRRFKVCRKIIFILKCKTQF